MATYSAKVDIDEEIYCKSVMEHGNDFEVFTEDENARKKITGFRFKFQHDGIIDKNTDYLFKQKEIFYYLDFLSCITGYPNNKIHYQLTIYDSTDEEIISWDVDTLLPKKSDADLDLSQYQKTLSDLSTEKIENLRYNYAGLIFYINRLYEFSIREFFKIIEMDEKINGYKDYKYIRHLFSHHPDHLEVASEYFRKSNLKNKFKELDKNAKNVIIDRYNLNNVHELLKMAKELKGIVEPRVLN